MGERTITRKVKVGAHPEKALSAAFVRTVTTPGRYSDGNGLALVVDANGAKRWSQRIVIRGKRCDLGLGSVALVPLVEAREKARANRKLARDGGDPLAEKRRGKDVPTFDEAARRYLEAHEAGFKNPKHRQQWGNTLATYASPVFGRSKVSEVNSSDVLRALEPIWRTKTETATRLRGRIEAVLSWATVSGYRRGDNPARWKGNLAELLPAPGRVKDSEHHPTMPLEDAARWWWHLQWAPGGAARALAFLALTAARSGEVRGMQWAEVDLKAAIWTVPASRMKGKQEHRVPLSPDALDILREQPRTSSPYVFAAPMGGMFSDMALSAVMRRRHASGERDPVVGGGFFDPQTRRPAVPHGLRALFRNWAAESGFDRDMSEICLAHKVGSDVERAYRRTDMVERRRAMMAAWSDFLHGRTAKVVPLRLEINVGQDRLIPSVSAR